MGKITRYLCSARDYEYDPEVGDPDNDVAPGTAFDNLPDDWDCPVCGTAKLKFERTE